VTEGIRQRDWVVVDHALTPAIRASRGRVREALRAFRRYLEQHGAGITAPDAPSLGSIEGEVYHRVARRLTGRAARWSPAGSDHLVRLLAAEANGELAQALAVGRPQPVGAASRPALPRVNDSFKILNKDNSISPETVVEFPQRRQLKLPQNAC
jgi:hypothetical protein